jgi:hypothetical protein
MLCKFFEKLKKNHGVSEILHKMFGFVFLLCHPIKNVLTQLQFFLFFAHSNLDK